MVLTKTKETLEELALNAQFADASKIFVRAGESSSVSLAGLFRGKKHLYFTEGRNNEKVIFAFNEPWKDDEAVIYHISNERINAADGYERFIDLLHEDETPAYAGKEAIDFMRKKVEEQRYYV